MMEAIERMGSWVEQLLGEGGREGGREGGMDGG